MAVAAAWEPARALFINPIFDSTVTGSPNGSQIIADVNYADEQFEGMYTDPITVNINISLSTATTYLGESFAAYTNNFSYSTVRTAYFAKAASPDQITAANNNWPVNDPTGSNSDWFVPRPEAKALGLLDANNSASDGSILFSTAFAYTYDPLQRAVTGTTDFIGVAEHEISHVLGRVSLLGTADSLGKPGYDPSALYRYTAPGVRNFSSTAAGVYFSINNGTTNLRGYNNTSDADDWATTSPYTADSYNAGSNSAIANTITPVDVTRMDVLGYAEDSNALNWRGGTIDFMLSNWASPNQGLVYAHHGAELEVNSAGALAFHSFTAGENFELSSLSDTGQTLDVEQGVFEMDAAPGTTTNTCALLINQDGQLTVANEGVLRTDGPLSVGDAAGVTNALAGFAGNSSTSIGTGIGTDHSFYVGKSGNGTVQQSGNSMVSVETLYVGYNAGSNGAYNLSGGTLYATNEVVGHNGVGTFNQTGGTNNAGGTLSLSDTLKPGDSYTLGAGTLNVGTFNVFAGTLTVSGGTANVTAFNDVGIGAGNLSAGSINAATEEIASSSAFSQTGGFNILTGELNLDDGYNLSNGTLAPKVIEIFSGGTLTQSGGVVQPNILVATSLNVINVGQFTYSGGSFLARLINQGFTTLNADFTPLGGMENDEPLSLSAGRTVTFNGLGTLDNESTITLNSTTFFSATIAGTGTKTNNGTITGFGLISGSGSLINNGTINQTGGQMALSLAGNPYYNSGEIDLNPTFKVVGSLLITTSNSPTMDFLYNSGTINMAADGSGFAANIGGPGGLENASGGMILCNGKSTISIGNLVNDAGGSIEIPAGIITITNPFSTAGTIDMNDPDAELKGGAITNTGLIQGAGNINNDITNNSSGNITANAADILSLNGNVTNSGTITVTADSTVFVTNGIVADSGNIVLQGGTFDNDGESMTNAGQISGYGTFNAGSVTSGDLGAGTITLSGGPSTLNTDIDNIGTITVTGDSAVFNGNTSGGGTIQATNTTITFAGTLTSGSYSSTGSTNVFQSTVTTNAGGNFTGSADSAFNFSGGTLTNNGNFNNAGTLNSSDPTTNNATFTQSGPQNWVPGTTFTNTAGVATFQSDAGSPSAYNLSVIVTGGTVALGSSQHWAGLTVSGGGIVDVANNHIVITYGDTDPVATIYDYLQTGYNGGAWTGPGIDSSVAALPANSDYGIGFVDGADDIPGAMSDLGIPLTSGQILIAYALYGDVNLDGLVNATDFAIFGANFNLAVTGWDHGDFTYTGLVNATDFALLGANFGKSENGAAVTLPASDYAALEAFAAANGLTLPPLAVPEPASAGLMSVAAFGVLSRRRRAKSNAEPLKI